MPSENVDTLVRPTSLFLRQLSNIKIEIDNDSQLTEEVFLLGFEIFYVFEIIMYVVSASRQSLIEIIGQVQHAI